MGQPVTRVALEPGTILSSASAELQRQVEAMVPAGKTGALVAIVDTKGARIGVALSHKGQFTAMLEAERTWTGESKATLKLKSTW